MIRLENVSHRFVERVVLHDVSVTMTERRLAVVGANGSGKSTFVRLLNGLVMPTVGTVSIDGLSTRSDLKAIRRKVGFVFQDPDNQIVFPLVAEDIAFGLKNLKLPKAEISRRVDEVLKRYGLMPYRDQPAHTLSGGQKQLLAISSVLAINPSYLVFDEPTTLLDLRNKRMISRVIDDLEQPVIVVSHDLDFLRHFDRVLVFDQGRIVIDDVPDVALPAYEDMMA